MTKKKSNDSEREVVKLPVLLEPYLEDYSTGQLSVMLTEQTLKLRDKVVDKDLADFAVKAVINEIRKETKRANYEPRAKAVTLVGFKIGDSGLWDKIGNMIAAAQAYVKKNGVAVAIQDQYINGDGQVLDRREKIFGRTNSKFLEPLEDKVVDCSRTLHLIAKVNGEGNYKYGTMQTNDSPLARGWSKVKDFIPCQTFGIIKENYPKPLTEKELAKMSKEDIEKYNKLPAGFKTNSSLAEETTSVFKAIKEDMDVTKIFMDTIGPQLTEIENVERDYELTKDAWDRIMFVRGTVSWIGRDRPSPFGAIKMGIMDNNGKEVVVQIPDHVSKDFGELSDIVVIGKPVRGDLQVIDEDTGKKSYQKGKGDVYVQAVGIFVVKGTPVDVYSSEQLGESIEIEGWIP